VHGFCLMPTRSSSHLERILGRLDDLDEQNLAILVQRLARERSLLETVFNTIREGILVIDRTGSVEYANQAGLQLIGLRENDIGKAVLWKVMPELARSVKLEFGTATQPHVVSREIEVSYPEHRHLRLYFVPFEQQQGLRTDTLYALILTDITEERISSEKRIEDERLSSIFILAAGVAHEIGNPLNSINIHLQLMQRQIKKLGNKPGIEKLANSVDICYREVGRLDGIINNFLEAIRPRDPDFQDVRLLDVLREVLDVQRDEIENRGIAVEVSTSDTLPIVAADRDQIKQVFFNILKNAMEAMGSGGQLRLTTRSDDEFVFIHIADTGTGISQDEVSRIFQPYFTTKKTGHGLGMVIVQRIMRAHGGQIGLDSEPGVGTIVTLQFPQKHRRVRMITES